MRAACLLFCASLLACKTSDLGSCASDTDCSSNAICDGAQRVCVLTDAPQISNVAVTSTPGYSADGGLFFDTAGAPLAVSATITSRAGAAVDPASACLRITGETGACAHAGTAGGGDTFTFALPRPAGPADGTPLGFAISAASASGHTATSATQQVYFDDQPPSISIVNDPAAYARTLPDGGAASINVSAAIADATGVVSPQLHSGTKTIAPSSATGGVYVFPLDPRDAPAGVEGAYGIQVSAQDNLGHSRQVSGSVKIDDAPPTLAIQIYKDVPDGGGITYPAAVANTGWTGAMFVYSDTVHVTGTITDMSGVGSATLRVDGVQLGGAIATGAPRALGCTPGTTSCPFSLDVTLNDAGVPFHTGATTLDVGGTVLVPAGNLRFTIDAQDTAAAAGGTPSPKAATSTVSAQTTRYLWQRTLSGAAVSGLAVHPDGDLIVSMDGGTGDTVYSLAPDQPVTHWGMTLDASVAADGVIGTPAIGAGDAASARIYVAGSNGDFYAINPNGTRAWSNATVSNSFVVSPAVTQVTIAAATVDQIVLPDGRLSPSAALWRATSATDATSVASDDRDWHASPVIFNGDVFFATQNQMANTFHLTKHSIGSNGALGTAVTDTTDPNVVYFGLITDGTDLYAATRPAAGAGILLKISTSLSRPAIWSVNLASGLAGEPTIGIDGLLYGADLLSILSRFSPVDATVSLPTLSLGGVGLTPLQGSDGHLYVPRRTGFLAAYEGNQLSWSFDPPGTILRYATMDCQGRLFAASNATVYAFVSDDRGLADTPWPSLRRDARNTGNASAPLGPLKYGMRTASGCTQ